MPATAVPSRDELVGQSVGQGRFRLERLLGSGSSGRVYLARQSNLNRPVAVKVMRRELECASERAERFHREALLASNLNHPNIASVIDCSGPDDKLAFIAMEYVNGDNLYRMLEKEGPLELDRVLDLFIQVLDGLEEAHEAGIVHADLKSPNVIVARSRLGVEQPKLVDFGIAVSSKHPREDGGMLYGTPEYLAPEVIRGQLPTTAADIYGAGIMLYELIVGAPPFASRNLEETLRQQLEAPAPHLPVDRNAVLDRLDRVVHRALAKDPRARYRSVSEFRAAVIAASLNAAADGVELLTIRPRRRQRRRPLNTSGELPTIEARRPPLAAIRARLRDDIFRGDVRSITRCYLELAAALLRSDQAAAAVSELEEGVAIISGLGSDGGELVWRLQLALAAARVEVGDLDGAIVSALRCLHQCQRDGAIEGCLSTHSLLARLYAATGQDRSATRHRETIHVLQRRLRRSPSSPRGNGKRGH